MDIEKQLFVLDLEQGLEVRIPQDLNCRILPSSYRFYDPLIKITQKYVNHEKKKFLSMQMLLAQLVAHFENKHSVFGSGDEDASVDDDEEGINRYFENMIDVHDSLHTGLK